MCVHLYIYKCCAVRSYSFCIQFCLLFCFHFYFFIIIIVWLIVLCKVRVRDEVARPEAKASGVRTEPNVYYVYVLNITMGMGVKDAEDGGREVRGIESASK